MVGCAYGMPGALVAEVDEGVDVSGGESLAGPGVELRRPVGRDGAGRGVVEKRQTVRGEAGSDDQHTVVAQRTQSLAKVKQTLRIQGGHRDL